MHVKKTVVSILSAGLMASPLAYATNGMLMEGYGPVSTGMGGASMAYDNGTAGMANNPATLGLMPDGTSRLDVAVGGLHPTITSKTAGMPDANSGGKAYYMPAAGWVKKDGALTYGIGMFSQGGMGTEYSGADWLSMGSGKPTRSEVGIGNVIVPLAYDVSPDFKVGGSLDLVWAGMDMQMALPGSTMMGMMGAGNLKVTTDPLTYGALGGFMAGPGNVGYFNFSDNSKFTGKASSTGLAGKLGMTLKVSDQLTVGATYHTKTSLGDMKASGATMEMYAAGGTPAGKLTGDVSVVNFQFPEVIGIGAAYKVTEDVMLAVDYKRIGWANVMKNFHMTFVSPGMGMGPVTMDMTMPQNWVDQDVFNIGLAYRANEALTLRAGMNLANNPVPNNTVHPLFPAIIKNHYTIGAGYALDKVSELNGSLVYAPKVTVTSPATPASPGYTIDHSQTNWQMMYTHRF